MTANTDVDLPSRTRGLRRGAPCGEDHPQAKMTEAKVREMRQWYAEGNVSMFKLAEFYGIDGSTARYIIRRLTWKHVTDIPTKQCGHCCGSGRVPM